MYRRLTQRKLDVLDQLEEEHIRIELRFFQWRLSKEEENRKKIFSLIHHDLLLHMHKEESLFYPACAEIPELKEMVLEGIEEHKQVKHLLKDLADMHQKSDRATAKMKVLMEEVEHHVSEEENDLFPRVRSLMKKGQFNKLSRELRRIKQIRSHAAAA